MRTFIIKIEASKIIILVADRKKELAFILNYLKETCEKNIPLWPHYYLSNFFKTKI